MSHLRAPMEHRIPTPLGRDLLIVSNGSSIVASDFVAPARATATKAGDALLVEASAQVRAYFRRRLRRFDLPLALDGTAFRVAVWRAVARPRVRRVRVVCRRRAGGRAPAGAPRRRDGDGSGSARLVRTGASRHRRGRQDQRRAAALDARAPRGVRAREGLGNLAVGFRQRGVCERLFQKARLVRDDVFDERELRMPATRRDAIAIAVALQYLPLDHDAIAPRAPCARGGAAAPDRRRARAAAPKARSRPRRTLRRR